MANDLAKNPIKIDTLGLILNDKLLVVESVQWVDPVTANDTVVLEDQEGNVIFQTTCVTAKQNLIKYYFRPHVFKGLKLIGLGSGRLDVLLSTESFNKIK